MARQVGVDVSIMIREEKCLFISLEDGKLEVMELEFINYSVLQEI